MLMDIFFLEELLERYLFETIMILHQCSKRVQENNNQRFFQSTPCWLVKILKITSPIALDNLRYFFHQSVCYIEASQFCLNNSAMIQ